MALPIDQPVAHADSLAPHLSRALARLRFALAAERAATEQAAALAAEADAANRDLAAARGRCHDLEAQLDHLAEILIGRERYVAVLQGRWRRVRAGRSPRHRLARLWRSLRRSWPLVLAAALTVAMLLLPHLAGR